MDKTSLKEFIDGIPERASGGEWYVTIGDDVTMDYYAQGQGVPASVYYGHAVRIRVGRGVPRLGVDDINHLITLIEGVRAALNEGDGDAIIPLIRDAEDFLSRCPCDFVADRDWLDDTIAYGAAVVLDGGDLDDWLDGCPAREYIDDAGAYAVYDKTAIRSWVLERVKEELLDE